MTITSLSGRAVPLILDHADYGSAVLLQGAPIPWTDLPALVGYLRQVQALLDPDALYLDAGALLSPARRACQGLIGEMAARSRTGYALRTLLASPELLDFASVTIRTAADAVRREVTLAVPSPRDSSCGHTRSRAPTLRISVQINPIRRRCTSRSGSASSAVCR